LELAACVQREWLETNGLGGFASATVSGIHTRRYHGLLTAATKPPVGRVLLLSKFEETLIVGGQRFELSANRYPDGVIHPQGYVLLADFRLDPFPVFVYRTPDGIEVEKRVFMVHGQNTTVVEYEVRGVGADVSIELRPLIAFRDYHSTTHENDALNPTVYLSSDMATVRPYADLPALHIAYSCGIVEATGHWYRNFEYMIERERGLDFREDLFQPFVLKCSATKVSVIASTTPRDATDAPIYREQEIRRRGDLRANAPLRDPMVEDLTVAADQFIVQRGGMKTVIAGYHWFSDWGRDTMIALPGLAITTGRPEIAKSILLAFANVVDQGMLPNRFPDAGEAPEYNTVDATLWFFEAVRAFLAYTGDIAFVRENLYSKLKDIVDWHIRGTRYGIRMDPNDGLLRCGEPGVQLTWMDAKVGDWVVTPRYGKPVEIQALWFNALRILQQLTPEFDDYAPYLAELAALVSVSFNQQFWNPASGCLFDVVDGHHKDGSIRPNQIFAVSLEHSMLSRERARSVVAVVQRDLLTPVGLRSLAPTDPKYRGRYEGGVLERDSAYHQGTVWPWLIGGFISAYLKVHGESAAARQQAGEWLRSFEGMSQIPEIADGDPPHTPRGCIAQAWSVSVVLRGALQCYSGSANDRMLAPAATEMYCLPSIE
jgi:predicted glycogen debranching enzyme